MLGFGKLRALLKKKAPEQEGPYTCMQLIDRVYDALAERHPTQDVPFVPKGTDLWMREGLMAHRRIASDTDLHRSREGFISYDSARIVTFDYGKWVLARGFKTGDYPGEGIAGNLIGILGDGIEAVPQDELPMKIRQAIMGELGHPMMQFLARTSPFHDALIVAMADGSANFTTVGMGKNVDRLIGDPLRSNYVATPDLQKPGLIRYSSDAVEMLANGIEHALRQEYDSQA